MQARIGLVTGGLAAAAAAPVLAHSVDNAPLDLTGVPWSFEPWVVLCLAVSGVLYGVGLARLWRHAGRGHGVTVPQASAFAAGWLTLAIAEISSAPRELGV